MPNKLFIDKIAIVIARLDTNAATNNSDIYKDALILKMEAKKKNQDEDVILSKINNLQIVLSMFNEVSDLMEVAIYIDKIS